MVFVFANGDSQDLRHNTVQSVETYGQVGEEEGNELPPMGSNSQ